MCVSMSTVENGFGKEKKNFQWGILLTHGGWQGISLVKTRLFLLCKVNVYPGVLQSRHFVDQRNRRRHHETI